MKKSLLDKVKRWWAVWVFGVAIFGFVVTKSSQLLAVWNSPQKQSETEESVTELSTQLKTYTAANEAEDKQRDELLKLLTQQALQKDKKGWL